MFFFGRGAALVNWTQPTRICLPTLHTGLPVTPENDVTCHRTTESRYGSGCLLIGGGMTPKFSINQVGEWLSSSSIVKGMNLIISLETFILHSKTRNDKTVICYHQANVSHFYDPPQKTSLPKTNTCLRWNWFHQRWNVRRIQRVRNLGEALMEIQGEAAPYLNATAAHTSKWSPKS